MRTAKYYDYVVLKIVVSFIVLVILGLSVYFIFVKPNQVQDHVAGDNAWVTVEPTCHSDGYRYKVCEECGEMFDRETLAATDHKSFKTVKENEKKHTETEGGSYESVVYCKDCGEEISRETVLVDNAHTIEIVKTQENVVEPTCDKDGSYVAVVTCLGCNKEISRETVTVKATGHEYEWTVVYDKDKDSFSLNGVCGIDGSETSVTGKNSDNFVVTKDETVASCCLIRYIVSCTYNGEEIELIYISSTHEDNHTIEYYEDQDSIYDPQPTYIVLPDPKVDPVYGEYYDIDEIPGIKPYNVGNSVWDENGFSYGVFKCHACEEFECTGCCDSGYRFVVRIYSAKYDTRLEENLDN